MSLFTSKRERRLWSWTLAVLVAIFASLGLANILVELMQDQGEIGVGLFIIGCLLVLATVVSQGLTNKPGHAEIAVAFGVIAAYTLVFVRMSIPTERSHLIEYGVLAIFVYEALLERNKQGAQIPIPALFAILGTSVVGLIDEGIQYVLPDRVFDLRDILFNVLAAVMAVGTSAALAWARRKVVTKK